MKRIRNQEDEKSVKNKGKRIGKRTQTEAINNSINTGVDLP